MAKEFDPITLEIMWSRLISIVDEAAATLVRTSFSTIVKESNDYACMLLASNGDSLEQYGQYSLFHCHASQYHETFPERVSPGPVEAGGCGDDQ